MPDLETARWRVARHYLGVARGVREKQMFKELDPDWPQVEGVLVWLGEVGGPEGMDLFSELVSELSEYWLTRGLMREMLGWCEQGSRVCAAVGRRGGEGAHLSNLGSAYFSLGQMERAIEHYEQALAIAREIRAASTEGSPEWTDARRGEGNRLGNLGNAYANLGQVVRAIEQYKQALDIAREIGDHRIEGNQLGNLGLAYAALGQVEGDEEHPGAIELYEQALEIAREIGDQRGEGNQLGNLGLAHYSLGRAERAREFWGQALVTFEKIKSPSAERVRGWLAGMGG